jgi:CDP-6-deoxy-D-xylo-4-hexulose-3-dehydrase
MDSARVKELITELSQHTPRYVHGKKTFIPGTTQVLYSGPYWDHREMEMALKAIMTGAWLTAGEYVTRFQNVFARHFGVRNAHMVNSGSSANLVMIAALKKHNGWKDGDEIVVSPVGFPTTIAPLVQNGLVPRFVDIELDTLNFDLNEVESALNGKTRGIFVSPVLGNPPDMDRLIKMSPLVGDNCDSLGSKWDGEFLNRYYEAWSASFYPAHHITTGEGGMVCSNSAEFIKTARSISWWGRDCYCVGQANLLACGSCGKRFSNWLGDDSIIDHKYLFSNMGYNLKPLDLQGAIGLAQMEKITDIEARRRSNFTAITEMVSRLSGVRVAGKHAKADPCWFGVPIMCDSEAIKNSLVSHLESNLIQTRPYFAGNILAHPGYSHLADAKDFPNANQVLNRVFFLGCPPQYTEDILQYISEVLSKWR